MASQHGQNEADQRYHRQLSRFCCLINPDMVFGTHSDLFKFKFRVDAQPVVEAAGMAISERLIQFATEKAMFKAIRDGKETAMRIENSRGVTSTQVFDTTGARKAFADLSRECPID
jgi:hypothetical protein